MMQLLPPDSASIASRLVRQSTLHRVAVAVSHHLGRLFGAALSLRFLACSGKGSLPGSSNLDLFLPLRQTFAVCLGN
jgi:hypothetical protein